MSAPNVNPASLMGASFCNPYLLFAMSSSSLKSGKDSVEQPRSVASMQTFPVPPRSLYPGRGPPALPNTCVPCHTQRAFFMNAAMLSPSWVWCVAWAASKLTQGLVLLTTSDRAVLLQVPAAECQA